MKEEVNFNNNPLAVEPVSKLIRSFAIPSIVSMLVGSLYNIVDQFFIGQKVGELGNAATNIAFPLSTSCIAIALLFGIGGASTFNIHMGKQREDMAEYFMGNAAITAFICGIVLSFIAEIFLVPMLTFFGASSSILPLSCEYTRITAIGFPMLILTTTGGHLIRADGRPKISMLCNLVGAIVNTILDALFVFVLGYGMAGAAIATVIGQCVSCLFVIYYLAHTKSVNLGLKHFRMQTRYIFPTISLGVAPFINQLAMMLVQIVLNNSLKYYGAISIYGAETAIAVVGIATKVNQVYLSFVIGMSQGMQPIASFNYGARKYDRVIEVYKKTIRVSFIISCIAWVLFFFFPREIISIFGKGTSETYYLFAVRYFKIYLFFTMLNFLQLTSSNFFTAIGKAKIGGFLSLTRQIIFLLPLLLILPLFFKIDGIMFAGPVADLVAAIVSGVFAFREIKRLTRMQN
ncbi:MATE family efflux transporter [Lachnospira sp.]|jgi:putative MATE family efflux protein|uniref:MATE family efflux transporter n=1 Tax=Lachnospira sp. TaxID=2049031 RepID=UPI00257A1E5C|nr:MATE family efflux transporter [Lachnospira sp.]